MKTRGFVLAVGLLVGAAVGLCQEMEIVRQFVRSGGQPVTRLVAAVDGSYYGTTSTGGDFDRGSIFRLVPDGAGFQYAPLYSFHGIDGSVPDGLIQGADSRFYGVTNSGGAHGAGTAFVFDPTAGLIVLHDFDARTYAIGSSPLTQASDGQLYGVTFEGGVQNLGALFRLSPAGDFSVLHSFTSTEGIGPAGALLEASDGYLYGTARYGPFPAAEAPDGSPYFGSGTLFRSDLAGNVSLIRSFAGTEIVQADGALAEGLDGNLYGLSFYGGTASNGTVFVCSKTGTASVLHSFVDTYYPLDGLTRAADGSFYGTVQAGGPGGGGSAFRITTAGDYTTMVSFPDGDPSGLANPNAGLTLAADGSLLGTTVQGGSATFGTIFRISPPFTDFTVVHEFGNKTIPLDPTTALVEGPDGTLWGTAGGGAFDAGTIYRLSGGPLVAHEFTGADGATPGELLAVSDGSLYGVTGASGPGGSGTVFHLDGSGALTTLHGFAGTDGAEPGGGLMQATDGNFYGTTAFGGVNGGGTMFRISGSGTFTKLHDFMANAVPEEPRGRILQAADGNLYFTGFGFRGRLYQSGLDGDVTELHEFFVPEGEGPPAGVIQGDDGSLYGTCRYWGDDVASLGTVYRFDPPSTYTVIHTFAGQGRTRGGVVQASDERLYGTTSGESTNTLGSVFGLDTDGGNFGTLHDFVGGVSDGATPTAGLLAASDGFLYGTTSAGGWSAHGLVFRMDLAGSGPAIAGVEPTSGPASGGALITIAGDHFRPDTAVTTGGAAPPASSLFDTHTFFAIGPALAPGSLNDVVVVNGDAQTALLPAAFFADFLDAPGDHRFHAEIEAIFRAAITAGCGSGNYCPDAPASRGQMAVLLLKLEHGPTFTPPLCMGLFLDVACPSLFADWIEQFAVEEITAGCGGGNYCPLEPVTREQSAVLILKAEHGAKYVPPPCAGIFADVPCASPYAVWIEQLSAEGITEGCGNGNYCPEASTSRGQMAVFLTRALEGASSWDAAAARTEKAGGARTRRRP